jgi:hypothetical protein
MRMLVALLLLANLGFFVLARRRRSRLDACRQLHSSRTFQRRADRNPRGRSRTGAARPDIMAAAAGRDGG